MIRGGANGGQGADGGGGSMTDRCAQCWASIPLISKYLVYVVGIGIVLGLFARYFLANNLYFTVFSFQIWRLFTNIFVSRASDPFSAILTGLISFLWISQDCRRLETEQGSMYFLHSLGVVYVLGGVVFLVICGLLSLAGGGFGKTMSRIAMAGTWGPIFGLMAVRCMLSQQPTTQLCCLPIQVPTKWLKSHLCSSLKHIKNMSCA